MTGTDTLTSTRQDELSTDAAGDTVGRDLLLDTRRLQIEANRCETARARATTRLFQHLKSDVEARRARDPHFTQAPLTETITETQPVTGQTPHKIRTDIETILVADKHLPWLAARLDTGWIDLYRAGPVIDALTDDLAEHPEARGRFSELMKYWFDRAAHDSPDLANKTITQIRNRVHYVLAKVLPSEFDRRFKKRHAARHVSSHSTGDGMAALTIDTDLVSVKLAEHHLDLLARDARSAGDERTLDQLRTDLAVDLLTGRHQAGSNTNTDSDSDIDSGKRPGVTGTGRWARPIINVTVPYQTLMGISDEPGMMGDQVIPASLVRRLAEDPDSTWYRLLTDSSRRGIELSTTAYAPTGPLWREVVALQPTCYAPTCTRPAAECDLDHRLRYPEGATSSTNLGPGCRPDHRAKHAPGASLHRRSDGRLAYTTRAGLTHLISPAEQPVCDDPTAGELWEKLAQQAPGTAELLDALEQVRHHGERGLDDLETQALERARERRHLRASYPHATDEDLDHWVYGDAEEHETPPITRFAPIAWDSAPEEELTPLAS
ncbi:MAG: HNH endonuclease signature motif containing protein [Nocardioides sp.]